MKCPSCFGVMEADGTCSCGYGVRRREAPVTVQGGCAWSDAGRICPCRGILSLGTNGSGPWYCREHWERLHRREPKALGNALPERPVSIGAQEWWKAWREKFGDKPVMAPKKPNPMETAA